MLCLQEHVVVRGRHTGFDLTSRLVVDIHLEETATMKPTDYHYNYILHYVESLEGHQCLHTHMRMVQRIPTTHRDASVESRHLTLFTDSSPTECRHWSRHSYSTTTRGTPLDSLHATAHTSTTDRPARHTERESPPQQSTSTQTH